LTNWITPVGKTFFFFEKIVPIKKPERKKTMKTIRRTRIKIKHKELVILSRNKESDSETIRVCPVCSFPITVNELLANKEKSTLEIAAQIGYLRDEPEKQ
jgi:hypothetical protein